MMRIFSPVKLLQNSKMPKHCASAQQCRVGILRQISAFAFAEKDAAMISLLP
jgi:hypothetical protein